MSLIRSTNRRYNVRRTHRESSSLPFYVPYLYIHIYKEIRSHKYRMHLRVARIVDDGTDATDKSVIGDDVTLRDTESSSHAEARIKICITQRKV